MDKGEIVEAVENLLMATDALMARVHQLPALIDGGKTSQAMYDLAIQMMSMREAQERVALVIDKLGVERCL